VAETILPFKVPYTCQFASRDRVQAFLNGAQPVESDPHWADYGAASAHEYAHWALRSCGVVCVKMAVEALTGNPPEPVMRWVRAGLALDGYLTEIRPDRRDKPVEKGWKHIALAELANQRGCHAELAIDLTLNDLAAHLRARRLVIASVTSELGENGPLTRASGHLVVVIGAVLDEAGQVREVIVHNPSGRTAALQEAAHIPAARFGSGFSGRGIILAARTAR